MGSHDIISYLYIFMLQGIIVVIKKETWINHLSSHMISCTFWIDCTTCSSTSYMIFDIWNNHKNPCVQCFWQQTKIIEEEAKTNLKITKLLLAIFDKRDIILVTKTFKMCSIMRYFLYLTRCFSISPLIEGNLTSTLGGDENSNKILRWEILCFTSCKL